MKMLTNPKMSRKAFLGLSMRLGGAALASSFLNACERAGILIQPDEDVMTASNTPTSSPSTTTAPSPTRQPEPTATLEPEATQTPSPTNTAPRPGDLTQVALVKTMDRSAGVRDALQLLGINPVAGKDVLLKPNFNSADPTPGSTHPDILRTLIKEMRSMGAGAITVGDRSGMGNTKAVMSSLGVMDMAQELGFDVLVFDDLPLDEWVEVHPPGSHWKQGFLFAAACLDCGALVQTCCLKTHRYGGVFTLSLKNSVGMAAKYHPTTGYNYMGELHGTPDQRRMIAEINAAYTPAFVVMDGVEAFVSGGPDRGQKATPGVVLAGTDRIAIDAIGVAILRQHGASFQGGIFEQEQIARAVELGLGVDNVEKIELLSADAEGAAYAEQIMELLRAG